VAKGNPSNVKVHKESQVAPQKTQEEESSSLRGTLASVLILGTLIALCWAGAFYLYLERM
jgi:hypothetical protein